MDEQKIVYEWLTSNPDKVPVLSLPGPELNTFLQYGMKVGDNDNDFYKLGDKWYRLKLKQ